MARTKEQPRGPSLTFPVLRCQINTLNTFSRHNKTLKAHRHVCKRWSCHFSPFITSYPPIHLCRLAAVQRNNHRGFITVSCISLKTLHERKRINVGKETNCAHSHLLHVSSVLGGGDGVRGVPRQVLLLPAAVHRYQ